jgi:hypothetical protein
MNKNVVETTKNIVGKYADEKAKDLVTGFKWTSMITSVESFIPTNYHVIGWNTGEKFDGYREWDIIKSKRVKCQLSNPKTKKCKHCGWARQVTNAKPRTKRRRLLDT